MRTAVDNHPMTFAGLPGSSWAFAIRIWLAIVVALYVSFWLELEAPYSAAVTVAILALPTRGQALEKAVFRLIATVLGLAASITIVGIFAQTGALLLAAFAAWLGLCVYAVGLLDGNRAYAAALSGYTVAVIAVQRIDHPQNVFESGVERGAAIAIGILVVTIVNDLLAAPHHHSHLAAQLGSLRRRLAGYARRVLGGETVPATAAAALLSDVVALRPEINSLAAETGSAPVRAATARTAMVGIVAELFAIRAVDMLPAAHPPALREHVIAELDDRPHDAPPSERGGQPREPVASALSWFTECVLQSDREVKASLAALADGSRTPQAWRAPLYRSQHIAAAGGIRAAACFLLVAIFFALCGWSSADLALLFVAINVALGTTNSDPRAFTKIMVVVAPVASLIAGIIEFVVLDGATAFPLLAMALAPFVISAALLISVPNRTLSMFGQLTLVYVLVLLAPSNPQTYDPQSFLFSCLFLLLGTGLLFVAEILVPLVSPDRRRQWLLESVQRDLDHLPSRRHQHLAPEEAMFRDASRIAQILAAAGNAPGHELAAEEVMASFDKAAALRLCEVELEHLAEGPLEMEVGAAYAALAQGDPDSILASAQALREAASLEDIAVNGAGAALVLASATFRTPRSPAETP